MSHFDGAITVLFVVNEAPNTSLYKLISALYMYLRLFLHVRIEITYSGSQKTLKQQAYKLEVITE